MNAPPRELSMVPLAFLGTQELLVVLGIVVFLFGAKKIPDIARSLGEGIRGFRSSLQGDDDDDSGETKQVPENSSKP